MQAIEVARRPAPTIDRRATVGEVARVMANEGIRALVIEEDGRPTGIVTDRDLVVRALARGLPVETPVESVMTRDPLTLEASTSLTTAYLALRERGVRQAPVVERGRVVGLLVLDDLEGELTAELSHLVLPTDDRPF